jgi:Xaa-Pro aminopeptidase
MDVHDAGAYRVDGEHRALRPGMALTVEPGLYVAAERLEFEMVMQPYDLDARIERRIVAGAAAAKQAEEAEMADAPRVMHRVPSAFAGIGVRIEDDILVTDDGHENLTRMVPVEPGKVESLCAETSWLRRD